MSSLSNTFAKDQRLPHALLSLKQPPILIKRVGLSPMLSMVTQRLPGVSFPKLAKTHAAVFQFATPLQFGPKDKLIVQLRTTAWWLTHDRQVSAELVV
jgi:hypothetical protein